MIVDTLQRNYTVYFRSLVLHRGKLHWMFLIRGTLQSEITLDVSNYGYITEEMLCWMFLTADLNKVVSKGHPAIVAGTAIVTKNTGQKIRKSEG
jgi:hypothetical protein